MIFLLFTLAATHADVCSDNSDSGTCYGATSCFWHPTTSTCAHLDTLVAMQTGGCNEQIDMESCITNTDCIWNSNDNSCLTLADFRSITCSEIESESTCWELPQCFYDTRISGCTDVADAAAALPADSSTSTTTGTSGTTTIIPNGTTTTTTTGTTTVSTGTGSTGTSTGSTEACADVTINGNPWADSQGYTCATYKQSYGESGMCSQSWASSSGKDGFHVNTACCDCGGGSNSASTGTSTASSSTTSTTTTTGTSTASASGTSSTDTTTGGSTTTTTTATVTGTTATGSSTAGSTSLTTTGTSTIRSRTAFGCAGMNMMACEQADICKFTAMGCVIEDLLCQTYRNPQACALAPRDCIWTGMACMSDEFGEMGMNPFIFGSGIYGNGINRGAGVGVGTGIGAGVGVGTGFGASPYMMGDMFEEQREAQAEMMEALYEPTLVAAEALQKSHAHEDHKASFPWHVLIGCAFGTFLGTVVVVSGGMKLFGKKEAREEHYVAAP